MITESAGILAVVVPTKDRPAEVEQLLASIARQSRLPELVVIVAAGSETSRQDIREFARSAAQPSGFALHVLDAERASLTAQKNQGVRFALSLSDQIRYIQIFDDDVRPTHDYIRAATSFLDDHQNREFGGVSGVTPRGRSYRPSRLLRLYFRCFRLSPGQPGSVTSTGRNSGFYANGTAEPAEVKWLIGCAMYRREIFEVHSYWDELDGNVLYEDVEFSIRVARNWKLAVLRDTVLDHRELSATNPEHRLLGFQQVYNRHRVVRTLGGQGSMSAFWWSVMGDLILSGVRSILPARTSDVERFRGLLKGCRAVWRQKKDSTA